MPAVSMSLFVRPLLEGCRSPKSPLKEGDTGILPVSQNLKPQRRFFRWAGGTNLTIGTVRSSVGKH